jgi:hypothetical protein
MKTLIAIVTCNTRPDWAELVRKTWVPLVPKTIDVRFFVGRSTNNLSSPDTINLDCSDAYEGLPNKVQEIIRWALLNGYDYVLKCDDDVVIHPEHLLASDYAHFDFTGHQCAENQQVPWGFCYWLSKKAMQIMAEQALPQGNNDEAWVSHALNRNGLLLHHEDGYHLHYGRNLGTAPPKRALRKPLELPTSNGFAWCMHNHSVPKEVIFAEFLRIFEKEVKTQ